MKSSCRVIGCFLKDPEVRIAFHSTTQRSCRAAHNNCYIIKIMMKVFQRSKPFTVQSISLRILHLMRPVSSSCMTSSGARAMRGFGAMCLLRKSRCVFLAPQCTALRCPWVSALLVPVVRVPSSARGPPCVFYCTCTSNLYYSTVL